MRAGFRSFSPALRWFLVATVINMIGSAMLFSFVFVYLNEVRGFSGAKAGLVLAVQPFAVVASTPLAGWLSDRLGPRRMLAVGCILSIIAAAGWSAVTDVRIAIIVSVIGGTGMGFWFPSQSALLALIVAPEQRAHTSAFQRTALNLGAALGGAIAGFIVDVDDVNTFHLLFLINALTTVVFLTALPGLPSGRVPRTADSPGFREVLADRFYLALLATDVAIAMGFGFAFAVMPGYAKKIGIGEGTIGLLFGIGAIAVVFVQMFTLRWVAGRDRMYMLAVMNGFFGLAFLLHGFSAVTSVGMAIALIAVGQFVAGIGETFIAAVRQPFTAELAPDELMGRYYGLAAMVFQGSMGTASAIGGTLLDGPLSRLWIVAGGISVAGVLASLLLSPAAHHRLRVTSAPTSLAGPDADPDPAAALLA
jgi:MFS family permease